MNSPLVSVIVLCYNHELFLKTAIGSVLQQTYSAIEVILVDDASQDNSAIIATEICENNPSIKFLPLKENLGNCKAFNRGLALATGEFIIDLSADDFIHPERIQRQVDFFSRLSSDYGVVFTDAVYIDENGKFLRNHFEYLFRKKLITKIPEGDVYADVLSVYFIASPTMMIKREVFTALNGYDETLAYEDFDFWVRSARYYKYGFLNERLTIIRRLKKSMSTAAYQVGDKQLYSTYLICKKAISLNGTQAEKISLLKRIQYELRQAVFSTNKVEAKLFYELLKELSGVRVQDRVTYMINMSPLSLSLVRRIYQKIFLKPF
jgi:glycosyltransferase involved in cell wall biosynthesis